MTARTVRYIVEFICVIWLSTAVRYVAGATATALVTVTILAPLSDGPGLALSALQLDMQGKNHEELTIVNHSSAWREIRVDLLAQTGGAVACNLHYSPMNTSIPPGGIQVVRVLSRNTSQQPCLSDHRLLITDLQSVGTPIFDVPVRTAHY